MVRKRLEITFSRLVELLEYSKETGVFTWKVDRGNNKCKGTVAGTLGKTREGVFRRQIMIDGVSYYSSRLAWLYVTGKMPECEIDHKNRDPSDDRWSNLRHASRSQNNHNRRAFKRKRDLPPGVYQLENGRFFSTRMIEGKRKYLGRFDTTLEAYNAYKMELE